jgi:UDP-glucuronate decarboxylase
MKVSAGNILIDNDIQHLLDDTGDINFKDSTILITGGAGFIGSWLCDVLINKNARIICIDNLSSGLEANIAHLLPHDGFTFIKHDITEPFKCIEKIDLVLHLASRASPFEFEKFPLEILKSNTIGTCNTLEIARKNNARFLFTSTSETYGNPSIVPTPESYYGNVNSIGVRGCYDESKRCGEAFAMAYKKQHNVDVRIARIFNTYGPRMRADGIYGRVAPRFISQALNNKPITIFGDGEQTRSFCYITDQIEGLLRLVSFKEAEGKVINIGNHDEIKVMDLAYIVRKLTGSSSDITFGPLPEDDPKRRQPDITKAKEILGWEPKVSVEEGLRKTIDWLKMK